ncbi:hypothetical protein [Streptomyces sp. NPDC102487]|uniref:hypothetical protein n=1 Tax=Streptomyces sp. NPDC102487 TaxID=3366182 RepID=UPI0037F507E4
MSGRHGSVSRTRAKGTDGRPAAATGLRSYRLDRTHHVLELSFELSDEDLLASEWELCRLLRRCRTPAVIVDVRTADMSVAALPLLLRLRQVAEQERIFLCVTVRNARAARMLCEAGLERILRVTRTFEQAQAWTAVGCPASPSPLSAMRIHLKGRVYKTICWRHSDPTAASRATQQERTQKMPSVRKES